LENQLRVVPPRLAPSTKPLASLWALVPANVVGTKSWLWVSAKAVAVMLLMARARSALLLSFMGGAPLVLFLMPVFLGEPAIGCVTRSSYCKRLP
jgi:hypothetical protein